MAKGQHLKERGEGKKGWGEGKKEAIVFFPYLFLERKKAGSPSLSFCPSAP